MHIARYSLSILALLAVSCGSPAIAAITKEQIYAIRFDGLHLGMTPDQVDAYIRSRADLGETRVNELDNFDCGYLLAKEDRPASQPQRDPGQEQPGFPRWMGFNDASGHQYGLRFGFEPAHAVVDRVSYFERRGIDNWQSYLTEAEARFGKADLVGALNYGAMRAVWCTAGTRCGTDDNESSEPQLSLTYYPNTPTTSEPGDRLNYEINEGRARDEERHTYYEALPTTDPRRSRRLYRQCTGPKGRFATEKDANRHYVMLASFGRRASKPIWDASAVPEPVFHALDVDPAKIFGPGVCFWPFDVFLNEKIPGCTSFTGTQFRWARRVDGLWLVALRFGGVATRDEYVAVRHVDKGQYQKIWWSSDMAGFSAWQRNGAVPMMEKTVQ